MTLDLESALEAYFMQTVRAHGGLAVKLAPTQRGIPDRLVILPPGELFLVELKTTRGMLSAIQLHWHDRLRDMGVTVHTLYGRHELDRWMSWAVQAAADQSDIRARVQQRRDRRRSNEIRAEKNGQRV